MECYKTERYKKWNIIKAVNVKNRKCYEQKMSGTENRKGCEQKTLGK